MKRSGRNCCSGTFTLPSSNATNSIKALKATKGLYKIMPYYLTVFTQNIQQYCQYTVSVTWWCNGTVSDLRSSAHGIMAISLSCNDHGQVVHIHTHISPSSSSIIWYWPQTIIMLCGSKGNCWPGGQWRQPITGFLTMSHHWADWLKTAITSSPNSCIVYVSTFTSSLYCITITSGAVCMTPS